jgi:pimeloyl-ACP methyl ester carboxylesterase
VPVPLNRQRSLTLLILINLFAFIAGCAFNELNKDLKVISKASEISGSISHTRSSNKPVIVVLFRMDPANGKGTVTQYLAIYGDRKFKFLVAEGEFQLFAFEDANQDLAFQHTEYVGWYGDPTNIKARNGVNLKGLDIQLKHPRTAKAKLPDLYSPRTQNYKLRMKDYHLGEVVSLDAKRFGSQSGSKGLWTPVKFLSEEGLGIFFLEPFSSHKIPVLFVHGAGGYPQEWKQLIDHLNRDKYQAWVFQYSSGMRLDWIAESLEMGLRSLQVKYKFKKLYIVAHSMGGLVAKQFVNIYEGDYVKLLVTISTPWGGHSAAQMGLAHAPAIIPSWYDMVPGSPFLKSLFPESVKPNVPYYLFFGYQGESSMFIEGNGDGTVSLKSMLQSSAQKEALKIYGFDADHAGILADTKVGDILNEVMGSN